ncbi:hypothetical protein Tco_0156287 [Tanacetum coccineum]
MLVRSTEAVGEVLEGPSESQPIPSPTQQKKDISYITTLKLQKLKDLKAQIKQLKKKTRPVINHHKDLDTKSFNEDKIAARKKKIGL